MRIKINGKLLDESVESVELFDGDSSDLVAWLIVLIGAIAGYGWCASWLPQ